MVKLTENENSLLTSVSKMDFPVLSFQTLEEMEIGKTTSIAGKRGVLYSLVKKGILVQQDDVFKLTKFGLDQINLWKPEGVQPMAETKSEILLFTIPKIASRFNTKEQFKIFSDLNIEFVKDEEDFSFKITPEQKEDLVKAIRESHIFSRMTSEKLNRFFKI